MNQLSILDTRPLAHRSPLAISVALHAIFLSVLTMVGDGRAAKAPTADSHHRSVIVLNFKDLPYRSRTSGAVLSKSQGANQASVTGSGTTTKTENLRVQSPDIATVADPGTSNKQIPRTFELPREVRVRAIKQTLLQFDVPPDVVLKQEVPLPNIVLWTEQRPVPFRKRFVAPPVKISQTKISQNMAPAPDLPNHEAAVSELKLSAVLASDAPRLTQPPATTSPVKTRTTATINQVPQIALPDSSAAEPTALVALADSPTHPNGMVIVPPANQISNPEPAGSPGAGSGGTGPSGAGQGSSVRSGGTSGQGTGRPATATISGTGTAGSDNTNSTSNGSAKAGGAAGNGSGPANTGAGQMAGNVGTGPEGPGAGSVPGSGERDSAGLEQLPANVTRITLPKDGKFGVVVTGSSQATPYPETIGALSGKMVYTVYLSVGLHKKWILQYCLTKDTAKLVSRGSATPLEAPWPILVFRPDHLAQPGDYVVVHGLIDAEGRFDQLAMVFPDQFDQKDLLISSLKHWSFRPASRDRQPTAIEILLIIPAES